MNVLPRVSTSALPRVSTSALPRDSTSALPRDPRLALVAVSTAATAAALSLTGEVSPVGLIVPVFAAYAVWRPRQEPRGRAFKWAFDAIALGFLAWFLMNFLQGRVLAGAAAITFPVQVHYLLQPPSLQSLKRLQTIGFFQLVALAASTTAIFFGPLLLLHLLVAPALLTLAGLESAEGEPRRPARLPRGLMRASLGAAAAVFVVGALFFPLLPRYEAGLLSELRRPGQRMSGFSESVSLGDITSIQGNDAIVMRVKLRGEMPDDLKWRGIALDEFTGRSWINTASPQRPMLRGASYQLRDPVPGAPRIVQEISLEPSAVRALFHLQGATRVTPETFQGLRVDRWGNLQRSGEVRRARYEVVSELAPTGQPLDEVERAMFLQLPDLDPRVEAIAAEAVGEGDDAARAAHVIRWLQARCAYSLDVNDAGTPDPVAWFLFDARRGHCEYFATTMAVLLRQAGIPARVVNGFQPGEYSRLFRAHIVRQRDAHSWVEAWLPGRGWTAFDPTPPSGVAVSSLGDAAEIWRQVEILWDDNIIGFNYSIQLGFLTRLGEWHVALKDWARYSGGWIMSGLAMLGVALLGVFVLTRLRGVRARRRAQRIPAFYRRAERLLARRGHRRRPSQTPWELAREAGAKDPLIAEAALEITSLYYDVRYGGSSADPSRVDELLRRLAA